jgi:hypothetical protein
VGCGPSDEPGVTVDGWGVVAEPVEADGDGEWGAEPVAGVGGRFGLFAAGVPLVEVLPVV